MWCNVYSRQEILMSSDGWMDWLRWDDDLILVGFFLVSQPFCWLRSSAITESVWGERLQCGQWQRGIQVGSWIVDSKERSVCLQKGFWAAKNRKHPLWWGFSYRIYKNISHVFWVPHTYNLFFPVVLLGLCACRLNRPGSHTVKQVGMPKDFLMSGKPNFILVSKWFNPNRSIKN